MKLTLKQILDASSAVKALDVYERVVREGGTERVVREPYRFGGATRMTLARTQAALQAHSDAFDKAHNALIRELANGQDHIPADAAGSKQMFVEEIGKLLASEHPIEIAQLSEADLKLDDNPIPPSVLTALLPLLAA